MDQSRIYNHPRLRLDAYLAQELGPKTYVVCVLWFAGWTTARIAAASGRTGGSIRGIVNRSLLTPRDALTLEERQNILDEMAATRQDRRPDGGLVLKESHFLAVTLPPLPAARRPQPVTPLPDPDLRTRAGRKEALRRRREAARQKKKAEEEQMQREMGYATKRGLAGAALEFLYATLILSDEEDKSINARRTNSLASRDRRKEAGLALRELIDSCRVGGMSSVDFEREVAGSSSGLGIPAYRLECISALGAIKKMMPDRDYELLEAVVDRDEAPWEHIPSTRGKAFIYEAIRRALDIVAVFLGLMARETFGTRWGFEPRSVGSPMDHDEAVQISRQARQMFRSAQRAS